MTRKKQNQPTSPTTTAGIDASIAALGYRPGMDPADLRMVLMYGNSTIVVSAEHFQQFSRIIVRAVWTLIVVFAALMPGSIFSLLKRVFAP